MIRTETEYKKALEHLARDADVLKAQKQHLLTMGLDGDELRRAMEPMESFVDQLKEEIEIYERMRRGDLGSLHNLTSIGRWLIGIRIAKGMTQRQLAGILEVSEAQVSRDEKNEYYGITVERAQRILEAFGVRFTATIEEPVIEAEGKERQLAGV
jgi:DNA-binding XRE family transcriptional regulator